jgi:hypothetical protein
MSGEIGKKAGLLLMGAAMLSLLFPGRRAAAAKAKVEAEGAPDAARQGQQGQQGQYAASAEGERAAVRPVETPARPPRRMWALVQYAPEVIVLAVSPSRSELERELAELNATWNHWELRTERQRYAIQAAPVLYPNPAGSAPARPMGSAAAG